MWKNRDKGYEEVRWILILAPFSGASALAYAFVRGKTGYLKGTSTVFSLYSHLIYFVQLALKKKK